MDKLKKFSLSTLLFFCSFAMALDVDQVLNAIEQESAQLNSTYRAYWPSLQTANKIKAEYHHLLLAIDNDDEFMVMLLADADKSRLQALGFKITPAKAYQARRKSQLDKVLAKLQSESQQALATESGFAVQPASIAAAVTVNGIPDYACYETVEETFAVANELVASYPDFASLIDIGDSWEKTNGVGGYDLLVMKITNSNVVREKPKLFIHSAMHAKEYTTAALTLAFAKELLTNYESNADIRWIVDYHEVHILFHMNPDGRKIAELGILKRKNNNTNHCTSSVIETGVDLNRNFSFFWRRGEDEYDFGPLYRASDDECNDTYRGVFAGSEPETNAVETYIRSLYTDERGSNDTDPAPLNKSGMHLDIHSFSNLILYPYAHKPDMAPNGNQLRTLARRLAYFNNYMPQQSPDLYLLDGNSESVSYGELGVAQLTFELGGMFFEPCDHYINVIKPDNLQALLHAAKLVAAPYQLPLGPYFKTFNIKGRQHPDITLGAPIDIAAFVSDAQFNALNGVEGTQLISRVEYSVDTHFYEPDVTPVMLSPLTDGVDAVFDSAEEQLSWALDNAAGQYGLGRHTLYLRAYDSDGNKGAIAARHFTVINGAYLEARISADCVVNACLFDSAESIDTDGELTGYYWQFGDGETSTQANPTHIYVRNGDFTIKLTVAGADGETHRTTWLYTLDLDGTPPTPYYRINCDGLHCQFDAAEAVDAENNIRVRRWFFGDGEKMLGELVEHDYAVAGNYTVTLRLRDDAGWLIDTDIELDLTQAVSTSYAVSPPANRSKGGGGSVSLVTLMLLGLLPLWRCCRK